MRKYIRAIMRAEAEKKGFKPSKAVHEMWTRFQVKKIGQNGSVIRKVHQARGTHPKRQWKQRYGLYGL